MSQIDRARGGEPYDNRPLEGVAALERAFAGGAVQRVGWYRFYFFDERWEWSPEVDQIHGYQPGTVTPTTQLVLSHKHPDDYEYIAATRYPLRKPTPDARRITDRSEAVPAAAGLNRQDLSVV